MAISQSKKGTSTQWCSFLIYRCLTTVAPRKYKMQVRKFQAIDFDTYQSWFSDELLNQHLGPAPDDEWLNHVLTDTTGVQYAFFDKDQLVGVSIHTCQKEIQLCSICGMLALVQCGSNPY